MPPTQTRLVGSGFTTFHIMGKAIAFLEGSARLGLGPYPSGTRPSPLSGTTSLGSSLCPGSRPRASSSSSSENVEPSGVVADSALRQHLQHHRHHNLQAGLASPITASTIIKKPFGMSGANAKPRGWTYANVNLIQIDDREVVQIGALTMPRTLLPPSMPIELYSRRRGDVLGRVDTHAYG